MAKEMKRRDVETALAAHGCFPIRSRGDHDVWGCPCDKKHKAPVPRHRNISAGVVREIGKQMACLPEGWLQ